MIRQLIATVLTAFALGAFALPASAAVDANVASQAELETVKGIGPGLSGKIIDARKSAPFKNWQDLVDRVGGVGPGNATKFSQAGLTVGGSTYTGGAVDNNKETKANKPAKDEAESKAAKARKEKAETPRT